MGTERTLSEQKTIGQAGVIDFHGAKVPVGYVASFAKGNCNCGCYGRGFVKRAGLNPEGKERYAVCKRAENRALRALSQGKLNPSATRSEDVYIVTDADRIRFEQEGQAWLAKQPGPISPASSESGAASALGENTEKVVPESADTGPASTVEVDERWKR